MRGGTWDTCYRRLFHQRGGQAPAILVECPGVRVGVTGKSHRRQVVPMVVVALERL